MNRVFPEVKKPIKTDELTDARINHSFWSGVVAGLAQGKKIDLAESRRKVVEFEKEIEKRTK